MTRSRRTFTAQEKAAAVNRYLVDKTPVSDLCDELGLHHSQVCQWQQKLYDNAHVAFAQTGRMPKQDDAKDKRIEALEAKIKLNNEVVAELLQEHVHEFKENLPQTRSPFEGIHSRSTSPGRKNSQTIDPDARLQNRSYSRQIQDFHGLFSSYLPNPKVLVWFETM